MPIKVFHPPGLRSLAEVDIAKGRVYPDPPCTIEVVVGVGGGGWGSKELGYRVHRIPVDAWRRPGEPLRQQALVTLRPIAVDDEMFVTEEGEFLRLEVLLEVAETRCVVVRASRIAGDPALLEMRATLRTPVVYPTEQFGDLVRDRLGGCFDGAATWNGHSVRMSLEPDPDGSLEQTVHNANELWADPAGWRARVNAYALKELLALKNDDWLGEGETEFTPDQFVARMRLETIMVGPDGGVAFWHDDGNLFWGHTIVVTGSLAEGPTDADIIG